MIESTLELVGLWLILHFIFELPPELSLLLAVVASVILLIVKIICYAAIYHLAGWLERRLERKSTYFHD